MNKSHPIGKFGKLWVKVTEKEIQEWRKHIDSGLSYRAVGKLYKRSHKTISNYIKEKPKIEREKTKRKRKLTRTFSLIMFRALNMAKRRSIKKGLNMDIDMKYISALFKEQNGKCALTGLEMTIEKDFDGLHQPFAPSIDRIDPKKGYTKENVRLTVWIMNHALGEWGEDYFQIIAKEYLKHKEQDKKI